MYMDLGEEVGDIKMFIKTFKQELLTVANKNGMQNFQIQVRPNTTYSLCHVTNCKCYIPTKYQNSSF